MVETVLYRSGRITKQRPFGRKRANLFRKGMHGDEWRLAIDRRAGHLSAVSTREYWGQQHPDQSRIKRRRLHVPADASADDVLEPKMKPAFVQLFCRQLLSGDHHRSRLPGHPERHRRHRLAFVFIDFYIFYLSLIYRVLGFLHVYFYVFDLQLAFYYVFLVKFALYQCHGIGSPGAMAL